VGSTTEAEITADGSMMYFDESQHTPSSSQVVAASRGSDGTFTKLSNSSDLLQNVNATGTDLYNSILTPDGLQLAFTKSDFQAQTLTMYVAGRGSTADPFGIPQQVSAATGLVENGSFSPDQCHLYHQLDPASPGMPWIHVVSRHAAR
jgi:hypothetical protein